MFPNPTVNEDVNKVVRFTNKTDFDFTPEMGAKYGGVPYFLPAGKSMMAPKPVAKLLAKHLARQTFLRKQPVRTENEIDGKGSTRPLFSEEQALRVADTFISDEYTEEREAPKTEAERVREKIADLNKDYPEEVPAEVVPTETEVVTEQEGGDGDTNDTEITTKTYADKAEVIAELTKRGIKFDARASKAKLEDLLK